MKEVNRSAVFRVAPGTGGRCVALLFAVVRALQRRSSPTQMVANVYERTQHCKPLSHKIRKLTLSYQVSLVRQGVEMTCRMRVSSESPLFFNVHLIFGLTLSKYLVRTKRRTKHYFE